MAEFMLECQGMIEPQAQQRGIHMTFPRSTHHVSVLADRTRVKQGSHQPAFQRDQIQPQAGNGRGDMHRERAGTHSRSIRDTGRGLSPEKLAQLFHAFNRLGQEASGEEGTGIDSWWPSDWSN